MSDDLRQYTITFLVVTPFFNNTLHINTLADQHISFIFAAQKGIKYG